MSKSIIRTFLLLTAFYLSGCGNSQLSNKETYWSTMPMAKKSAIHSLVEDTMTDNSVVGYSIGILQNGELTYKVHGGLSNIETQAPIISESRYQIYSATKMFFNIALMQLIERGDLEVDATLGTYLSDLPETWADITIKQAWSHMTGITDILDLNGMEPTAEEALKSVMDIPLRFSPGSKTEYNQTNFLLLREVFESITKTKYETYLKNELLKPVGIEGLPLGDLNIVASNLTTNYEGHRYEVGQLGRRSLSFPPYIYTSAGINISLNELITWWQAVLSGELVKVETLKKFWAPVFLNDGSVSERSFGWERQYSNNVLRIGHGGGARVHLFHYIPETNPEQSATIIFLNNGAPTPYFDHRKFGDTLSKIVLENK